MGALTYEQRVNKQEKNRKIRNIIITVAVILLLLGAVRTCAIGIHNQNEMQENLKVPIGPPPPSFGEFRD
jgi:flagellar basal body-associated protein FliL